MNEHDFYKDVIMTNLADREGIRESVLRGKKRGAGRGFAKWMCAAAAALVVLAGVSMAIPSVRAAILNWFDPDFRPGEYLVTPSAEREAIPVIEEAIEDVSEQAVKVELVSCEKEYEEWAKGLSLEFGEALYDGETVYISGSATGDLRPIFANYGYVDDNGDTEQIDTIVYATVGEHACHPGSPGEPYTNGMLEFDPDANGIEMEAAGEPCRFTAESIAKMQTGPCAFTMELPVFDELSGEQAVTLDLRFHRRVTVSSDENGIVMKAVDVAKFAVSGLTFDATAGADSKIKLTASAVQQMSGDVAVSSIYQPDGDKITIGNEVLSLDGGTFELVEVNKRLTGFDVTVRVTPPASWTDWQKQCFYKQLDYVLVINGDVQGGFASAYGSIRGIDDGDWSSNTDIIGDIRILEQDIAEIKSFKLVLRAAELAEYNGVKVPHDGSVTASYTPDGWNEDTSPVTFEGFALDVPVK